MDKNAAAETVMHASTVARDELAVLVCGASGSGKSSLCLQLMAFGAELVADDRTHLARRAGAIHASCPAPIAGLIEARGVGLIRVVPRSNVKLGLVIDLDQIETERLPEPKSREILGIELPCLHKVDTPAWPAAIWTYLSATQEMADDRHQ